MRFKQRQSKTMTMNSASTTHRHLCEPPTSSTVCGTVAKTRTHLVPIAHWPKLLGCFMMMVGWFVVQSQSKRIHITSYYSNIFIIYYITRLTYVLKHNKISLPSNIVCFPIYLRIFWVTALKVTLVRSRRPSSTKSESILRQRWAKVYEGFTPKCIGHYIMDSYLLGRFNPFETYLNMLVKTRIFPKQG